MIIIDLITPIAHSPLIARMKQMKKETEAFILFQLKMKINSC